MRQIYIYWATQAQRKLLRKLGHYDVDGLRFSEASDLIDKLLNEKRNPYDDREDSFSYCSGWKKFD